MPTLTKKTKVQKKPKLVIVESPAKAKTIEKFLGKDYKVEASQGHVRDLPKSRMGIEIENNFEMNYITIRGRGDILKKIRKEAKNASRIYLATDPDREGEAISWHLAHMLNIDPSSACRIEFHEITKKAIKSAIDKARPIDMNRVDAQQARRALDRLVGYSISPLLWVKIKKGLSTGRVQSVATKLVTEREQEIEDFIPVEYWEIAGRFTAKNNNGKKTQFDAKLHKINNKKVVINNEKKALEIKQKVLDSKFSVKEVKESKKLKKAQPPFITSSLQQEASRKLNFSTAKTMQVVQQLYEGINIGKAGTVGLVTYIRTDSVRVSAEAIEESREYISVKYGEEYVPKTPNEYKGRKNAQDAHEAIRPTSVANDPELIKKSLTKDQFNLYKLIYNRFIASQMKPASFNTLTIDMVADNLTMRYYGEHIAFTGYRAVYIESVDDNKEKISTVLPIMNQNDPIPFTSMNATQHFTQPPAHFSEASLVKTLEEMGIGRPSTYAPTITTIIKRGYITKEAKKLYPTELGKMVNNMMTKYFNYIIDFDFTAKLEDKLDKIEEGDGDWHEILKDFYPPFEKELKYAESEIEKIEIKDEVSDTPCDKCGTLMVYKMGKFGRFLACPKFPECVNAKPIIKYINVPCPKCNAQLLEKTSKKNRKFYGCEKYPECDFVSWDLPTTDKCEKCGTYMVEKRKKNGEIVHLCENPTCRHSVTIKQD